MFIPSKYEDSVKPKPVTTQTDKINLAEVDVKPSSLPSKGLPYPSDAVIKYRPYTYGEIKYINGSKGSEIDSYEYILKGIDCSFDKYLLSASDCLYLGFLRKISTLGTTKFKFSYQCQNCKNINSEILSLDVLEFIDLEIPSLPVTVDLSVGEFKFDVLRINKFFELIREGRSDDVSVLAKMCLSHKEEDTKELIDKSTLFDHEVIQELDSYLDHGIKPLTLKCVQEIPIKRSKTKNTQTCNFENKVQVEGGDNLVQPFRESKESIKNRIRFS